MLKIENDTQTLTQLGLTVNQARVYLAIVDHGATSAKEISRISKITQQDIYRVMPPLQKLGLVEKLVASPSLFKAISPEQALSILLERKEKENSVLHEKALKLIEKLKQSATNAINEGNASQFSIISGKKTILMKSKKAVDNACVSICILTSWENSAKSANYFSAIAKQALNKGVKIRFILCLPAEEAALFLRMTRRFMEDSRFEVKFNFTEKTIMFSVFDEKEVFFLTQPGSLGDVPILWSNNPSFIHFAQNYFEMLWVTASENKTLKPIMN